MEESEIGIWSCARISSQRCNNKMVRDFNGTTLTDIFLSKLNKIGKNTFFAGYEDIFKQKCKEHNVRFVQRSKNSSDVDEPASEIYNFLIDQNYKYLLQVNACLPLLKYETILKFYDKCKKLKQPAFAVFENNNYYVDNKDQPLNFSKNLHTINTKKVNIVKEFAHVFYFFEKQYFIENRWYWNWDKLNYITIPKNMEMIDIDTEDDFKLAEIIWKIKNNNTIAI